MEQRLDRHIIGVMADIGVPLRHIENFPERRETEETAEASRWPVRGFLIFTGDTGMGKSFGAALVLYEYLKSRVSNHFDRGSWEAAEKTRSSVMWSTAMDIAEDRKTAAQAKRGRLVVIDDLGSESDTPEGQTAIRGVLMKRYDMKLPTVVTTSLTMVDIDIRYGSRIANRLTEDIENGGSIIDCRSFSMHSSTLLFMAAEGRQNS
jgi:DNA replication protein DnaC